MKVYFKTYIDDNGLYFKNSKENILIRFAGKPQFLLEECIRKYGKTKGIEFYDKMTDLFKDISDKGFSLLVAYLYDNKKENGNKQRTGEENKRDGKSNGYGMKNYKSKGRGYQENNDRKKYR